MAKYPQAGRVKTRLTPPLSGVEAAGVYREFLCHFAQRLARMSWGNFTICFDPPDAGQAMMNLIGPETSADYMPQAGGDLGERMAGAVRDGRVSSDRILLLGV